MRISDWSSDVCSSDLLRRCNRLVVAIGVNPEFRLHPVFEDRHLDREIAVAEHPAAMRPTLVFGRGRRRMLLGFVGRGALTAGGEQVAGEQNARNWVATGHQRFSALARSEERRVGEGWVSKSRSRWSLDQ